MIARNATALIAQLDREIASERESMGDIPTPTVRLSNLTHMRSLVAYADNADKIATEMGSHFRDIDGDTSYVQGAADMLAGLHDYAANLWRNVACGLVDLYAAPF